MTNRRKTMFNFSYLRRGGLRFVKIGRLSLTLCVTREYVPVRATEPQRTPERRVVSRVVDGRRCFVLA